MDVRDALLDAATKVFAEAGMRGATTRRIAEAAGVNEVTLFRHFQTKHELITAALEQFAARAAGRPLPDTPEDPRAELVAWCRAHHRDLHRRRALIRKVMGEFEEHPCCSAQGMQASIAVARELAGYLERLRSAGLARGNWDARAATNMLMGALFTDAMGRDTMPERYPYTMRDAVERYVDLLLGAIHIVEPPASTRRRA